MTIQIQYNQLSEGDLYAFIKKNIGIINAVSVVMAIKSISLRFCFFLVLSQIVAVRILDIKAHIILNVFIFSIIKLNISRIANMVFWSKQI